MWNFFFNENKKHKVIQDTKTDKAEDTVLTHKSFSEQNPEEMEVTLKEGAKLFSRDFTRTIELLANE
jgi:hypothetical protein